MDPFAPSPDIPLRELGRAIHAAAAEDGLNPRTATIYVGWARRFVMHHACAHPASVGEPGVRSFMSRLAMAQPPLSASTLRQALTAIRFLMERVLTVRLTPEAWGAVRAKACRHRIPDPLPDAVYTGLVRRLRGQPRLAAILQLGCGLRLREALALRLADVDCVAGCIRVGGRQAPIAPAALPRLRHALRRRRRAGAADTDPLFVSRCRGPDRRPRPPTERSLQRAYRQSDPRITARCLRRAFELRLISAGIDLRQVQVAMGHRQLGTVMDHQRATAAGAAGTASPLDHLPAAG